MTTSEAQDPVEVAPSEPETHGELSCPRCGSENLHRSHRINAYERIVLPLVGIRPARCESCHLRFYSWKRPRH